MKRTAFIVGAGASTEFGLGAGVQLATDIRELLRSRVSSDSGPSQFGHPFDDAVRELRAEHQELMRASETIRRGLPFSNSIDDFLHDNRDNNLAVRLGKVCIAYCMNEQERQSGWLRQLDTSRIETRAEAFGQLRRTWLDALFRLLKRGKSSAEARDVFSTSSFIVFNYDRCIEQFLRAAIADALDLELGVARDVANSIVIEHVYGSLGSLNEKGIHASFGTEFPKVTDIALGIKTYTEEISSTSEAIIRSALDDAEQVVFLGYAFHEQGMRFLFPAGAPAYQKVFWTSHKVHDAVNKRVRERFANSEAFRFDGVCNDAIAQWQFELLAP